MTNMKNDADRRTIYGRFAAMARRRGLGAAITRHLVEQARWHRCGKIYLESSDMASALYGSLRVPSDGPHDAGPIVYREQARQDHVSGLCL